MTDYTGPIPRQVVIPVTKGTDIAFTMRRRNADLELVDWAATVTLSIDINRDSPTVVAAVVTGPDAVVRVESEIADLVRNSTTWQAVVSPLSDPTLQRPIMVGTFERHDGKATV